MKVLSRTWAAVAAAAAIWSASPAHAQDPYLPPSGSEDWKFSAAFYLWMCSMDGDISNRGVETEVDADFSEFFDKVESTFGFRFEAWQRESLGFGFDTNWLTLKDDPDFVSGTGEVEVAFGFTEVTVAGRTRSGNAYLDIIGGARWVRFETETSDPGGASEDHSKNYYDPMIGLRVGFFATSTIHGSLRFDIAGFNVGTERTSNLVIALDFLVAPTVALTAGWRTMAIKIDDENDEQEADLLLNGPVVAVRVGF